MRKFERASHLSRRKFLGLVGMSAGALALGSCGVLSSGERSLPRTPRTTKTDNVRNYDLEVVPSELGLGGRRATTWAYNGEVPGPEIRLTEGDTLRVRVKNGLPTGTTVHWHGLPIANAMDGVPGVTQSPIKSGEGFVYEFVVPVAGSYMYHSHVGLQLDRGLYGPLIVEPKKEDLSYDREYTLAIDDWLDGVAGTPEDALNELERSGGMGGMMGGGVAGELDYPLYLVNGRIPEDPEALKVRRGDKVRLRLINPAADTAFRFAVAGHGLTVTHADGLPVEHTTVDTVRVGMGERYDVLVEADNPGVWQVAAVPEGKGGLARTILRYEGSGASSPPPADLVPGEINGRLLAYGDLRAADRESFSGSPDRTLDLTLSGGHGNYVWAIDGQLYPDADPLEVREGEWARFSLQNRSMMSHPMHLHGHFFQVANGSGQGPFKDTVMVEPHESLSLDFVADNPGDWFFHCHNAYHMETGMARVVSYTG